MRCRVGSSPDSLKLAKCPVSHVSAVSNSDVSTTHPRPVRWRCSSAASTPMAAHMPVPKSSTEVPMRVGGSSSSPESHIRLENACTIGS